MSPPTEFVKKPRTPLCPNCGIRLEAGFGDGKDGENVVLWHCGICLMTIPTERVIIKPAPINPQQNARAVVQ